MTWLLLRGDAGTNALHHEAQEEGPDREGLSVLQENHRLRTAGLRRGTQLRGRSINHLIMVSGWWVKVPHQPLNPYTPIIIIIEHESHTDARVERESPGE